MLDYNTLNSLVEKFKKNGITNVKLENGSLYIDDNRLANVIHTNNITNLSDKDIDNLKPGDIVLKKTNNMEHTYIVTYKEEHKGICISYYAAGYSETVSYDYTDEHWVYNSTDIVNDNIMEEIHDTKGNLRFVEGNGTNGTISGLNITYNKWSLSGTHIMFVVAGSIDNATIVENGSVLSDFTLPSYIANKISKVWATDNIENKTIAFYDDSWSLQNFSFVLRKTTPNTIRISKSGGNTTANNNRYFRIQFDLLIDNE